MKGKQPMPVRESNDDKYEIKLYSGVEQIVGRTRLWGQLLWSGVMKSGKSVEAPFIESGPIRHFLVICNEKVIGLGDVGVKGSGGLIIPFENCVKGQLLTMTINFMEQEDSFCYIFPAISLISGKEPIRDVKSISEKLAENALATVNASCILK